MGSAFLVPWYYDENGKPVGDGVPVYMPDYLDRISIRAKAFWFLERGMGEPLAKRVLLMSQGQQWLVEVTTPLQRLNLKELKEKEDGLEAKVTDYVAREGIDDKPLNQ